MSATPCPICNNDTWGRYFSGRIDFDTVFAPCEHERDALEAEEAAGMRKLDVVDRDLCESPPGVTLEAFCTAV